MFIELMMPSNHLILCHLLRLKEIKGFSVVNEAEVDVSLEFLFFYDPTDVGNFTSGQTDTFGSNQLWLWY